jgi:hypothetical protein
VGSKAGSKKQRKEARRLSNKRAAGMARRGCDGDIGWSGGGGGGDDACGNGGGDGAPSAGMPSASAPSALRRLEQLAPTSRESTVRRLEALSAISPPPAALGPLARFARDLRRAGLELGAMVSAYALGNLADAADPNYNLGDLGGREALDELLVPYSDQARAPARTMQCTMQCTMHHTVHHAVHHAPCSAPCSAPCGAPKCRPPCHLQRC